MLKKVVNKVREAVRPPSVVAYHYPKLKRDPNFRLENAQRGLMDRPSIKPDPKKIERIIEAYNRAKARQRSVDSKFLVSNEWLPIYEHNLGAFIRALQSRDTGLVTEKFHNFMRDELSTGLLGMPVNMQRTYFSGKATKWNYLLFLIDSVYRFRFWRTLLPTSALAELVSPDIGNPYGIFIDGKFIRHGAEYQHYYATKTLSYLEKQSKPVILELGAGYGGYAYFLHALSGGKTKYIDVDLPEILALASFYLMHALPEKKFLLYGESLGDYGDLDAYDFLLLPNFEIESIPKSVVSLIFNSYSLAEMSREAIETYVREFGRLSPDAIFHVNHVHRALVGADSFGIEKNGFELTDRKKALWNLGRNLAMDEFEFVYKRRDAAPTEMSRVA